MNAGRIRWFALAAISLTALFLFQGGGVRCAEPGETPDVFTVEGVREMEIIRFRQTYIIPGLSRWNPGPVAHAQMYIFKLRHEGTEAEVVEEKIAELVELGVPADHFSEEQVQAATIGALREAWIRILEAHQVSWLYFDFGHDRYTSDLRKRQQDLSLLEEFAKDNFGLERADFCSVSEDITISWQRALLAGLHKRRLTEEALNECVAELVRECLPEEAFSLERMKEDMARSLRRGHARAAVTTPSHVVSEGWRNYGLTGSDIYGPISQEKREEALALIDAHLNSPLWTSSESRLRPYVIYEEIAETIRALARTGTEEQKWHAIRAMQYDCSPGRTQTLREILENEDDEQTLGAALSLKGPLGLSSSLLRKVYHEAETDSLRRAAISQMGEELDHQGLPEGEHSELLNTLCEILTEDTSLRSYTLSVMHKTVLPRSMVEMCVLPILMDSKEERANRIGATYVISAAKLITEEPFVSGIIAILKSDPDDEVRKRLARCYFDPGPGRRSVGQEKLIQAIRVIAASDPSEEVRTAAAQAIVGEILCKPRKPETLTSWLPERLVSIEKGIENYRRLDAGTADAENLRKRLIDHLFVLEIAASVNLGELEGSASALEESGRYAAEKKEAIEKEMADTRQLLSHIPALRASLENPR